MERYDEMDIVFLESLMKAGLPNDLCGYVNDIRRLIFEENNKGEQTDMRRELLDSVGTTNNGFSDSGTDIGESNKVFRFATHEKVELAKKNAFKEWASALEYLRDK